MSQPPTGNVVVIGAGIAGLSAAHELVRRKPDLDVVVVDPAARPGGVIDSERRDGYLCETAADAFVDETSGSAAELCRELGVELVAASSVGARRWVYRRGHLRLIPSSPPALLSSDLVSIRGRLRLLVEPFARAAPIGDETVAQFGRRRLGDEATEALLGPIVLGLFAGDAEKLSLAAALPRIAALEAEHGSLLRGLLAARGGGDALRLVAPRDGVAALIRSLAARLGERLRLSTRAIAVERSGHGQVVRLEGGGQLAARHVVVATPPRAAAVLVAGHDERLAARLRACPAVGVVIAHIGVAPADLGHPLDGYGFLVAQDEDLRCLGCVFESTLWPGRAPGGSVLLRLLYGGARDPAVMTLTDDDLARAAESDLERALGLRKAVTPVQITRWPHAIPQYNVGHRDWVAEVEEGASALGLVLAGSAYHGVSVNDCVRDARRIADRVIGAPPPAAGQGVLR